MPQKAGKKRKPEEFDYNWDDDEDEESKNAQEIVNRSSKK